MDHWRETVENGVHEFRRDFGGVCGVTLTITKLDVPGAWACCLPDGKRVVGELRTVRETVERIMDQRNLRTLPPLKRGEAMQSIGQLVQRIILHEADVAPEWQPYEGWDGVQQPEIEPDAFTPVRWLCTVCA